MRYRDKDEAFKFFLISRATRSIALVFVTLSLPLYMLYLHYQILDIGIIYFAIIAVNALFSMLLGALGDRVGYKNALIIGETLPLVGLTLLASYTNITIVVIAAALSGVAGVAGGIRGTFSPGSTALIVSNWKNEKRRVDKLAKTIYVGSASAILGGLMLYLKGAALGAFGEINSFRILFGVSAFLILISLISLFFVVEVRRPKKTTIVMKIGSLKYSFRVIASNVLNGFGIGIALPLLPIFFVLKYGVNTGEIGAIYTISYAATALAAYFAIGRIHSKKFSALLTASYTRVLQGLMLLLLAFSPFFALASVLFVIRSFVAGFGSPSRSAVNMRGINDQDYGTASSVMGLANRLSQTSSGLSGYLMELSLSSPALIGGAMQMVSGFIYLRLLSPKKRIRKNAISLPAPASNRREKP